MQITNTRNREPTRALRKIDRKTINSLLSLQGQPVSPEAHLHRRRPITVRRQHDAEHDHRDLRARVYGAGELQGRDDHKKRLGDNRGFGGVPRWVSVRHFFERP